MPELSAVNLMLAGWANRPMLMREDHLRAVASRAASRAHLQPPTRRADGGGGGGGDGGGEDRAPDETREFLLEYLSVPMERVETSRGAVVRVRIEGPVMFEPFDAWYSGGVWGESLVRELTILAEAGESGRDRCPVVLDWNCPGGTVAGLGDLVAAVQRLRASRPVYSLARDMMCSLAYWVGCSADEVVTTMSADLGSVGVIARLVSWSEMLSENGIVVETFKSGVLKDVGNPTRAITDTDRKAMTASIEEVASMFFAAVAERRGLAVEVVRGWEAGCATGAGAVAKGMADRVVEDVGAFLDSIAGGRSSPGLAGGAGTVGATGPARGSSLMAATSFKSATELREACPELVSEIEKAAMAKGRQEGLEAGKAEGKPKAATLAELQEKFKGDENAAFVLGCLSKGATMAEAIGQRNDLLEAQLAAEKKKSQDAQDRLEALSKGGVEALAAMGTKIPGGPVAGAAAAAGGGGGLAGDVPEKAKAFHAQLKAAVAGGAKVSDAMRKLAAEDPEGHQAYAKAGNPGLKDLGK